MKIPLQFIMGPLSKLLTLRQMGLITNMPTTITQNKKDPIDQTYIKIHNLTETAIKIVYSNQIA